MKSFEFKLWRQQPSEEDVEKAEGKSGIEKMTNAGNAKKQELEMLSQNGWEIKAVYQAHIYLQRQLEPHAKNSL